MGKGLTSLLPGIYQVRGVVGSNVYLIREEEGLALIDAGWPIDRPAISRALTSLGGVSDLKMVVVTHYHGDHMGSIRKLKRNGSVPSAVGEADVDYVNGRRPYERFKIAPSRRIFYSVLYPFFRYRTFEVDRALADGDEVDLLGGLEVIHTPGHTIGSICLYGRQRGILFSGDLVRNERGILEGPPPQFTPDPVAAAASLRKVAGLEFDILLPGHGVPVMSDAAAKLRALLQSGDIWPLSEARS